jgi:kynurenine formamidase
MARRVIDLTLPFDNRNPRLQAEPMKRIEVDGWNITRLTFDTHAGTHLDAPSHQLPGGGALETVDLNRCVGPAFVCDLRSVPPFQDIEVDDFAPWADRIVPGSRVLYRTDWTTKFGQPRYREGFPCPSVACATWLADRGIVLLGMDTPSVGPVYRTAHDVIAVHLPLLRAGVVIVEEMCNLAALPDGPFEFVALPLSLTGSDGSPTRAVALVDD